jgi:hypothetical protein
MDDLFHSEKNNCEADSGLAPSFVGRLPDCIAIGHVHISQR